MFVKRVHYTLPITQVKLYAAFQEVAYLRESLRKVTMGGDIQEVIDPGARSVGVETEQANEPRRECPSSRVNGLAREGQGEKVMTSIDDS